MKPIITIVTPEYNYAKYLPRLIGSCLAQTDPRWRLLIVDDASTDVETVMALEAIHHRFPDRRISVFEKVCNMGSCNSIALGFSATFTRYCATIDSDNFLLSRYVELMTSFLDENPDHVAVICAFLQHQGMRSTGQIIRKRPITLENSLETPPGTMTATFRTEIALECLPRVELAPDFDMTLRAAEYGPIGYLDVPLIGWEDHKDSRWWRNLTASREAAELCKREAKTRRKERGIESNMLSL